MPGEWMGSSRLRASCASLVLICGLATSAAHAEPVYLPTPEGTQRFGRSAVNTSVLRVFSYAETERRQTFCGPTSLAIVMNSLGVNDPTPASPRLGKHAFYAQEGDREAEAYALTCGVMVENAQIDDAQEGMRAFLEKRAPSWSIGE